ncbi:MAG: serine hydrolase domain-containing protein [Gaiellaceae bacterium]
MTKAIFTIALLATFAAAPAVDSGAGPPTSPLTQRLLHANEIAGYTPVRPSVKVLGLDALASVSGRTTKQLARAGFQTAAVENLRGPSAVPRGFVSQSSLIRFRTGREARTFLATVVKEHSGTPPGVRRSAFALPAVLGARGTGLIQPRSHGRLVEYDVLFVAGPFEYEVNVFSSNDAPSQAGFVAAVTSYYHRLAKAAREAQLQRALDQVVATGVPGAVLLVRDGERTTRLTSGYGSLRPRTRMRAGDRFRVGSITKTFVATVALQLVGEQKLGLEDTVERWLPGVVPNGTHITVRQLLNHTSGLFDYGGDRRFVADAFRHPLKNWTPRRIVAIATAHKPRFAPGAGWSYSDTNYYVLGLIIEAATKHSLAGELRHRIFAPLRLHDTSFPTGPRIAGHYAHGYFLRPLQDVSVGSPSVQWAAGALVSNADDLARFYRALLDGRLLRADLLRAMETVVTPAPDFSYGLGLMKLREPCGSVWGHTGGSPGYVANALNSKDGTRQVVVFVNATAASLSAPVNGFQFFHLPKRAGNAVDRLIQTAYCR